jgi:RHS repeat-associated protein
MIDTSAYDTLDLAVNVGTSTAVNLYLYFRDGSENLFTVVELDTYNGGSWSANTWEDISIPLADIDMDNYSGTASFHVESDGVAVVNYDNIEFVGTGGGGGSTYANPHAATSINGVSQSYDNNGNLTGTGSGLSNTWNYQNRLTQSRGGTATTTYLYDETGQRTAKTSNSFTTHYPFSVYEAQGATTTKHIYAGDILVATIQSDTPSPKTYYNHQDHLGSTNVVSTSDGYLTQVLDYYPFGSLRVDESYGDTDISKKFTGFELDRETDLSYAGARYLDCARGQFTSQDPVFQAIGDWKTVQEKTGDKLGLYLQNPQTHNSYSYAANNPIRNKDQSGEYLESVVDVAFIAYDLYKVGEAVVTGGDVKSQLGYLGLDVAGLAVPGGTGFGLAGRIAAKGGDEFAQGAVKVGNLGLDSANTKSVQNTLERIKNGDTSAFKQGGTTFNNKEGLLPKGNYKEYTVETPGLNHRGEQRIVHNVDTGEKYYTGDHYKTFKKIEED